LSCAGDVPQHAGEDELVKRIQGVPVDDAEQSYGIEDRRLANRALPLILVDLKFQPGSARDFHLGLQPQPTGRLVHLHPPEIERIADA
jgi:hypothetical protein